MSHPTAPLSLAQIHSVYASTAKLPAKKPSNAPDVNYSKISFAGRDPGHPGSPPPRTDAAGKKGRR
jgi:hypothetical protein